MTFRFCATDEQRSSVWPPFFRPAHMQSRLYKSLKEKSLPFSRGDRNHRPSQIKDDYRHRPVYYIKPFYLFSAQMCRQLIKFPCPCLAVISLISAFKGAQRSGRSARSHHERRRTSASRSPSPLFYCHSFSISNTMPALCLTDVGRQSNFLRHLTPGHMGLKYDRQNQPFTGCYSR